MYLSEAVDEIRDALVQHTIELAKLADCRTRGLHSRCRSCATSAALVFQRFLPASFQFARHQTVLRLDGLILTREAVRFITGALELLLPMLVQPLERQDDADRTIGAIALVDVGAIVGLKAP